MIEGIMDDNDCLDCDIVWYIGYSWRKYKGIEYNEDDDDDDDDDDEAEVEPCQIGNGRGKDKGIEADQGIARHGKVRHLKIWKGFTLKFEKVSP